MTYNIQWLIEQRVMYVRAYGHIQTLQEVYALQRDYFELLADSPQPVHTIVDILEVERFPLNIREMRSFLRRLDTDQVGLSLMVVNTNPLLRYTAAMMIQLTIPRTRLRIFTDLSDAQRYLQRADRTLPLLEFPATSVV